jgi:UDP-N-acetylmuramyl pentapeptide phosphotransferase/UDP-N-acetylglucosamine-1-phosphate transferase
MTQLFYAGATALLFSFLLMPLLTRFLRRRQVLDEGGRRKIHKGFIPSMGGIIICVAFLLTMFLWIPIGDIAHRRFEVAAIVLIFFAGIRDDLEPLRPLHKLMVQIIAAGMVVIVGDIRLFSLYGLFGVYELPLWLSYFGSLLIIVFITNAFNLIDGIDGLAGTIAVLSFSFLCCWFFAVGQYTEAVRMACIIGALVGFLYYNWQPASIFMGDTGSLVVGFFLAVSTLTFITTNGALPADNGFKFSAVLSAGIIIVLLPVFDTTRVFLLRLSHGKSPFLPDKQHLHHLVLHIVKTHAKSVCVIVGSYIIIAGVLLVASKYIADWILLPVIMAICVAVDILFGRNVIKLVRKRT